MIALTLLLLSGADPSIGLPLELRSGKLDRMNEPVRIPLTVPAGKKYAATIKILGTDIAPVVVLPPGLNAAKGTTAEAWFVLPRMGANQASEPSLVLTEGAPKFTGDDLLTWKREKDHTTLFRGKTPVLRYEHPKLDPKNREATFKVYHHAYSPEGVLLTKGVGGEFTHHRGLFYGFMKTTYDGHTVDIWHCKKDTHQAHQEVVEETPPNPVVGRHRVKIAWNGDEGKTFATEERELAAFPLPGGTLIEFTSRLTPTGGDVKVDGDPQHAGFHFRANNEVAGKEAKAQTVFVRPDGVGKPGTETNWPGNKKHVDLPWLGMSFVIGKERYTAAYLDKPTNPKEARFSERTYGRVGSYFVATATKEKPLVVNYRVWLQKGQMKPEAIAALDRAFVDPVGVKVK